MKAVTPRDEIGANLDPLSIQRAGDPRFTHVFDAYIGDFEVHRTGCGLSRGDQVLDHLLLSVDRDPSTAGELGEWHPVRQPVEAELDAPVEAVPHGPGVRPGRSHA